MNSDYNKPEKETNESWEEILDKTADLYVADDALKPWKTMVKEAFKSGAKWQKSQNDKLPNIIDRETLDEYAYQVAYDMSNDWMIDNPTWNDVETACKLGAKWQKEQIMANAIDMTVGYWMPNGLCLNVDETENPYNIDEGNKVKLIILKK